MEGAYGVIHSRLSFALARQWLEFWIELPHRLNAGVGRVARTNLRERVKRNLGLAGQLAQRRYAQGRKLFAHVLNGGDGD